MAYREDGLLSNSSISGIGLDWFEGALVRPDNVLSDVAHAINSSSVPKVSRQKYCVCCTWSIYLSVCV